MTGDRARGLVGPVKSSGAISPTALGVLMLGFAILVLNRRIDDLEADRGRERERPRD